MQDTDFETLLLQIRRRYDELRQTASKRERFIAHIQSLGHWEQDPMDYPDVSPEFPETLPIAFAVCHPDCGTQQLIVEGSTQECQQCGRLLFRVATADYTRK